MATLMSNTSAIALSSVMLASLLSVSASAFPAAPLGSKASEVILVAGKCKAGYHRDENGHCRPDEPHASPPPKEPCRGNSIRCPEKVGIDPATRQSR